MPENNETSYLHRLIALVSLAAVSTTIGIFMKLSMGGLGRYEYSPYSANCMTELYKLIVSLVIVFKMCSDSRKTSGRGILEEVRHFYEDNLTERMCLNVLGLTCMYVIVNMSVFGVMAHSTASNFFLMKASSPIITAFILVGIFGRSLHRAQWLSIAAQCVGILSTQFDLCRGNFTVGWVGYTFIVLNISVSCVAGVWNEHIIKTLAPSVNAMNTVMYVLGVAINLGLFFTPAAYSALGDAVIAPPSFFYGFDWSVWGVVIANGSVGLVITAVYKYADVVVKTFGIAGSVVTLFALETFGVLKTHKEQRPSQGSIAVLGSAIVFLASYVYILPKPAATEEEERKELVDEDDESKPVLNADSEQLKHQQQQQQHQQSTPKPAPPPYPYPPPQRFASSLSRNEWALVIICGLLVSILLLNRCPTMTVVTAAPV